MRAIKRNQNTNKINITSSNTKSIKAQKNTSINTNYDSRIKSLENKINKIKECNCDKSVLTNIQSRLTSLEINEFSINDSNDINLLIQKLIDYGYLNQNNSNHQVTHTLIINAPYKNNEELYDENGTTILKRFETIPNVTNEIIKSKVSVYVKDGAKRLNELPTEYQSIFKLDTQYKLTVNKAYLSNPYFIPLTPSYFGNYVNEYESYFCKDVMLHDNAFDESYPVKFLTHPYTETIDNINFVIKPDKRLSTYYILTFPENIITIPSNKFIVHETNSNIVKLYTNVDGDTLTVNNLNENKFILECDSLTTHYVIKFTI